MKYEKYKYIFPPRPKNAIPRTALSMYDNGLFMAQYKLNGSNCVIFTDGDSVRVMNRHGQPMSNFKLVEEVMSLYRGNGWMVINGEYLNKSKKDENGILFNHKLVLFDILVYNDDYMVGKTFEYRNNILNGLYQHIPSDKSYLTKVSENVYIVKNIYGNLLREFEVCTTIDMVEGLVIKKRNSPLEIGLNEMNNTKSQIKCRKLTKNYQF